MKKLIQLYAFCYGCIGSFFAFVWYLAALRDSVAFPRSWWIVESVFVLHCIAACFTFQPHVRPPWQPFLAVTPRRIKFAKIVFTIATLNFIVYLVKAGIVGTRGEARDRISFLILTSLLLQNTVYIAIHWAFRPENLFPHSFIQAISNPLGSFLGLFVKQQNDRGNL